MKKKEIKYNFWKYFIGIILVVILCSTVIYVRMPKRYCYNEQIIERVDATCGNTPTYDIDEYKVTCESGVALSEYKGLGYYQIWGCLGKDGVCLVEHTKKVCEIR